MFQLQNTPIPQGAIPVARESLAVSDAMRGLQAMNPPNEGMYNADDGGGMSKPVRNPQPMENAFLAAQNDLSKYCKLLPLKLQQLQWELCAKKILNEQCSESSYFFGK